MSEPNVVTEGANQHSPQELADRLREAREYLGLPQQLVADRTGISRVAISAIENGRRRVEAIELERLARLYRHPIGHFLGAEEADPPGVLALAREARTLSESDRQEVLRFARFLRSARAPSNEADELK